MEGTLNIRKSDTEMFVREISKESPEYPQKLLHYEGMPEILYVRGTLPDPRRPAVAIVGQPVHTGVCRRFVMPEDSVKKECKY